MCLNKLFLTENLRIVLNYLHWQAIKPAFNGVLRTNILLSCGGGNLFQCLNIIYKFQCQYWRTLILEPRQVPGPQPRLPQAVRLAARLAGRVAQRRGDAAAPGRDVERRELRDRRAAAGHRPRLHQRVSRADENRLGEVKATWTVTVIITCDESHTYKFYAIGCGCDASFTYTGEGFAKSQISLPKMI